MDPCLTERDIDRYHLGEMGEAEQTRAEMHLAACPACGRRDSALVDANEELLGRVQALGPMPPDDRSAAGASKYSAVAESRTLPTGLVAGYRLVREIHRGGQGIVYEAVQESTKQTVALKVLLEGHHTSSANRRRFEREIELVAGMKHTNIVTVYDSGTTTDGRQYCVMDYVAGLPLDEHLRRNSSSVEQVLGAFISVCEAVHYAHQRGVIHRDLKPSNIIVDSEGAPKVLDFGLAKNVGTTEGTLLSLTGQVLGTLPYLSPEQARGIPDDVDVRTDVYALGVILYELLTGQYPYPVIGQIVEILRHIAETPPTPPIRRWTSGSGVTRRDSRRLRAGQCPIDDDLQTIVLKSLSKECERRYQSAGDLARDVARYLAAEPIAAKQDSGWYILKTTIRRHKISVAVAAGFVFLMAVFAVTVSVMYAAQSGLLSEVQHERNRAVAAEDLAEERLETAETARALADMRRVDAEVQRAEAERQARMSQAVNDFLNNDLLASVSPDRAKGVEVTVREVLDAAARNIEGRFAEQPSVEAQVRQTIGWVYYSLGHYPQSQEHLERALTLRREVYGTGTLEEAQTMESLAFLYGMGQRDYVRSSELARQVLQTRRRLLGPDDGLTLRTYGDTAMFEALARGEMAAGLDDFPLRVMASVRKQGESTEQMRTFVNKLLLDLERQWASGDREGAIARMSHECEPLMAVPLLAPRVALTGGAYALVLHKEGILPNAAEAMAATAVELGTTGFGEEHPNTIYAIASLGVIRRDRGRYDEAEPLLVKARDLYQRVLGENHHQTLMTMYNLAALYIAQGAHDKAESLTAEAVQRSREALGTGNWSMGVYVRRYARILTLLERYGDAQRELLQAHEARKTALGAKHERTLNVVRSLADLYTAWHAAEPDKGYDTKAAVWRANLNGTDPITQPN